VANGIALSGNFACVADEGAGLSIINIANPQNPYEAGHCETPSNAFGVAVSGDFAYVADDWAGLRIINIADPQSPYEAGYHDTPDRAFGVAVSDSFAYVADAFEGLRIINVANPQSPYEAGFYNTPCYASGVAVCGSFAYVADYDSGLRVINVANPQSPCEEGYCVTPGYAEGVAVSGNFAYVAEYHAGLQICEFLGAGVEEGGTPNAARSTLYAGPTVVRGVLQMPLTADRSPLTASLLDLSGRRVLELHAGLNDVSRLAPGVYFASHCSEISTAGGLRLGTVAADGFAPGSGRGINPLRRP
jgi:hypothetical protein